ncbi:hypothetical protein [Daejeonella sp. H1SJ63]|jgi:hypothetical protein|uniref:hypothetical protein n=1 Tax=Daejeonella sp. H1SJ63 TaxID=3034145 RepID=UPI0023EDF126|nr:hypothetical protein [Daejeonella sp. H1SJ63]
MKIFRPNTIIISLKALLIAVVFLYPNTSSAQQPVKMHSEYGSKNQDVARLLEFQGIDQYRSSFNGESLKGRHFLLTVKSIWGGELTRNDTIMNTVQYGDFAKISTDSLEVFVTGARVGDELKVNFRFPKVVITRKYKAVSSDDYSLRAVGDQMVFKPGVTVPAYVFMLPYENGDGKYYCTVQQSGGKVEDWGKKFKLKHYLVFEMKFI